VTEPLPHITEDPAPKREATRPRRLILAVVGAGALFLAGTGVGVAAGSTTPPGGRAVVPSPAISPTVQAAPQACLEALSKAELAMEHARTGFGYTSELMGISGDGFTAAANFDSDGLTDAATRMNGVTDKISALTPQMGAAVTEYQTAAASCRSGT
jgi:hypothetical protein